MKRQPRLTKRERKALEPPRPRPAPRAARGAGGHAHGHEHIHCIACGRHLDPAELSAVPPTASMLTCQHGSRFASCTGCVEASQALIDEHDRLGQPVRAASAWH
jgi:hypothetical protein